MTLTIRLLVALGLTWAIGFERELRGAAAGDRTFALIGVGSAVIGYLALDHAPNALAGVVTGIGFIGAGLIVHGALPNRPGAPDGADVDAAVDVAAGSGAIGRIRGVTTAATMGAGACAANPSASSASTASSVAMAAAGADVRLLLPGLPAIHRHELLRLRIEYAARLLDLGHAIRADFFAARDGQVAV